MRRAALAALASAALLGGLPPAPAHAQPAQPDPQPAPALSQADRQAQAERLFQSAEELYRTGEYLAAANGYEAAYQLSGLPGLLYNVAQSFRLAGEKQEALDRYREFLARAPDHPLAAVARGHIQTLERELSPEPATQPKPAPEPVAGPVAPPPAIVRRAPADSRGRELRVVGVATAAAGLVSLGAGVYFGLRARDASAAIDDNAGPWTGELLDRYDEGDRDETRMLVFTVAGGAALVTGGVLYWLGWRAGAEATRSVSVSAAPGSASVGVAGRF